MLEKMLLDKNNVFILFNSGNLNNTLGKGGIYNYEKEIFSIIILNLMDVNHNVKYEYIKYKSQLYIIIRHKMKTLT